MIRKVQFKKILNPKEGECHRNIAACLRINPPLDATLIEKLKMIKGEGWVDDRIDYAAIFRIDPKKILLESGCPAVWCSHMRFLISKIVEVIKEDGEVNYEGPSFSSSKSWPI